jgi:hypothetical protein
MTGCPARPAKVAQNPGNDRGMVMGVDHRVAYAELIHRARELGMLASCSALLGWDEQTYMPKWTVS